MTKEAVWFVKVFINKVVDACVLYKKNEKEIKGILSPLVDAFKEMRNQSKAIEDSKWCMTAIVYHRYDYKKRKLLSFSNLIRSSKTISFRFKLFNFSLYFYYFLLCFLFHLCCLFRHSSFYFICLFSLYAFSFWKRLPTPMRHS